MKLNTKTHKRDFGSARMNSKFENDLRESCECAAEFLRKKNVEWNKVRNPKARSYSGEREFVAELYRLMVEKDKSYRHTLFVDYLRPDEAEKDEKAVPDLVYRNGPDEKSVVEIKTPVDCRTDGTSEPLDYVLYGSNGKGGIKGDYHKLKKHYSEFKSKFIVVAYLGDLELDNGKKFSLDDFKSSIVKKFPDTDEIKVIVC